ncbi:FeoA family protein [Dapis sp. BLCC M126]|uniref:FeoA family protein n=1 Tax=Dapis sp. BLCC M126 TaxID=3400189 RepID=UPI003CF45550
MALVRVAHPLRIQGVLTPGDINNFPLTQAKRGDRLCIVAINAEGDMTRRLKKMGLVVGVELEVLSHNPSGSKIVAVENHNIGLESNPAKNIIVSSITTVRDSS